MLRFGPGYVELVRTGLKHPSRELRLASFALLERTAPEPKEAFEIVLDCFTDMDLEMRLRAIQALNRFGPQSRKAVNLLGSALHEKDEKLCAAAMKALAEMGPDAEPACPALILLMSEEKSHEQAIVTLVAIGKGAVKDLSHALRNRDPHVRVGAANALGRIGADARSTAIALSYLSRNDPYPGVRQAAQKALTLVQAKK
ncbi:MAG: HEAT repeat domain-containing protein [Gemmataceae bacterium]